MLYKIMVAVVGGTILSLIFGYLFAYWRELMNKQAHGLRTDQEWEKGFSRMTSGKEGELAGAARRTTSSSSASSSSQESKSKSRHRTGMGEHPELLRLLDLSRDFYPDIYQYFCNIQEMGEDLGKWEMDEFKKFTSVKGNFLVERMSELLEMRYFDRFLGPEGSAKMIRASWLSYSAAYLFGDDARLGSSTICEHLEKKLHLPPQDLYRAVEFALLLSKGGSRLALKESYKKKIDQSFERSTWLQEQTKEQRIAMIWSLCHEKSFHALGIEGVVDLIEKAAIELEAALNQAYQEGNREEKAKTQQKTKQQKTAKPRPSTKGPYEQEFCALEMAYTSDISLIKKQYKKLAMKYHPDRQGQESSQERFVAVQRAYQTLEKAYSKKAA